jgi:hypothetical protein
VNSRALERLAVPAPHVTSPIMFVMIGVCDIRHSYGTNYDPLLVNLFIIRMKQTLCIMTLIVVCMKQICLRGNRNNISYSSTISIVVVTNYNMTSFFRFANKGAIY